MLDLKIEKRYKIVLKNNYNYRGTLKEIKSDSIILLDDLNHRNVEIIKNSISAIEVLI